MQTMNSWMRKGFAKGREEGKLDLLFRQLDRRVGELEPELAAQVQQLSSDQVDELSLALLDFTSRDDLLGWLEAAKKE